MQERLIGKIHKYVSYTLTCASCGYVWGSMHSDGITTQKAFIKSIRKMGWRQIRRHWVCPRHK
jgi:hypothetical protein